MTLLYGTSVAAAIGILIMMAGYGIAGFMSSEDRLTRLAVANLAGLAWVILAVSALGTKTPLHAPIVWLIWLPSVCVWFVAPTRRQMAADIGAIWKSRELPAAAGGFALLWLALLLPYIVYPDLAFFDGRPNHDNFFWSVAGEYLQHHDYLTHPVKSREFPLFNMVDSIIGWKPGWGRMGSEGYLAVTSGTFLRAPVQLYNFLVCILAMPWLLTVLSLARRMGLPRLNGWFLALVCFCQPILFFFIANANLPNLFGAIFSGGLWLFALLICEPQGHRWPLAAGATLVVHGMLCCYPEILPFSLVPVGLLVGWHLFRNDHERLKPALVLTFVVIAALCLNPVSTLRAWNGFWNSIDQVKQDTSWADIFAQLTPGGYVPALITLSTSTMRLYGLIGGLVASAAVLASLILLVRDSARRALLLISLSGFGAMLVYTVLASFGYGWQKSVQFFGISLSVLFPVLLVGKIQDAFRRTETRWPARIALIASLAILVHGMFGSVFESLKSAGYKDLTRPLLALRDRIARDFPGQPIYIDGPTFRSSFFHSMWSARLFAGNPLVFLSREDEAGGYLRDFVTLANPTTLAPGGLYYVDTNWARAFDYQPVPLVEDRVGVLLRKHNLVPEATGFYRPTGVPMMAKADFSFTIYPYADGWLEFILEPNGEPSGECRLEGSAITDAGVEHTTTTTLDDRRHLTVRFPLRANTRNVIAVRISGAPAVDLEGDDPPFPFRVLEVNSGRVEQPGSAGGQPRPPESPLLR